MTVKVVMTVGVMPSSRLTNIVKLPICVIEGDIVNVYPDRVIKASYVAVIVTKSPSGSENDGRVYVFYLPAPTVKLVNEALNDGG